MATHGSIREFNPVQEDWVSYTEHLIQYFMANGISAEGREPSSSVRVEQIHISLFVI